METIRFRNATEDDVDWVAEIVHGTPGRESIALLGGPERARRFGFAVTHLQARGSAWQRTILAELGQRRIGVLQWRRGEEPVLPMSLGLAWTTIRALGLFEAAGAWRRAQIRQVVEPSPPPGAFHVEELHVLPELRGQGIGASLLDHAEKLARAQGFHQISLITHNENPAQRLYRRAGFSDAERREDPAYQRLTGISGRLLMTKDLTAA